MATKPKGTCDTTPGDPGACNPYGYGPGQQLPANRPVIGGLGCTIAARIQTAIDRAEQRGAHALGLRPYRVRLVWQERNADHEWREVTTLELSPVEVKGMDALALEIDPDGLSPVGKVKLRKISPSQVDEETLRGNIRGIEWSQDTTQREFFYEIQQLRRCAADPEPRRYRMVLADAPFYDAERFQWRVNLHDQRQARTADGRDVSVPQDPGLLTSPRVLP